MAVSRNVQALHEICDKIDMLGYPPTKKHNAKMLSELIQKEALGFQQPNSPLLAEMVSIFKKAKETGEWLEKQGWFTDLKPFIEIVQQWYIIIDEVFFFDTLTREINSIHGPRQPMVPLKIKDKISELPYKFGEFRYLERDIRIFLRNPFADITTGQRPVFEEILYTVVHESVHAFLHTFSDHTHPCHEEWVKHNAGDGTMFLEILGAIIDRVEKIFGSLGAPADAFKQARTGDFPSPGGAAPGQGCANCEISLPSCIPPGCFI